MSAYVYDLYPRSKDLNIEHSADLIEAALGLAWVGSLLEHPMFPSLQRAGELHGQLSKTLCSYTPKTAAEVLAQLTTEPGQKGKKGKAAKASKKEAQGRSKPKDDETKAAKKEDRKSKGSRGKSTGKKSGKPKRRRVSRSADRKKRASTTSSSSTSSSSPPKKARRRSPSTHSGLRRPSPPTAKPEHSKALLQEIAKAQLEALCKTRQAYKAITLEELDLRQLGEDRETTKQAKHATDSLQVAASQAAAETAAAEYASSITAEVFDSPPDLNGWTDYFALTKAEARITKKAKELPPPQVQLAQKSLDSMLKCARFGRPFGVGALTDHWIPIRRLSALLKLLVLKHQPDMAAAMTAETTLAIVTRSWETEPKMSPFQVLYSSVAEDRVDYAYARAKQCLIAQKSMAPGGGPLAPRKGGQASQERSSQSWDQSSQSWR
jgi:hypothetical protein